MNSPRVRGALIAGAASVLAGLCLVLLLPGIIQLADGGATPTVVAAVDPSWDATDEANLGDSEFVYAAPEAGSGESVRTIDEDTWSSGGRAHGNQIEVEELACIIEPFHSVEIGSPVTGLIEKIHVEWSDFVEAGQVLVELESGAERAAVRLARAQAEMNDEIESREARASLIERRRARLNKLYEQDTLSLDLREEAETEAKVAQIQLAQAYADKKLAALQLEQAVAHLTRRTIRSPLNGVVVKRMMSPGERVENKPILTVAQIDPLRVEVILPASAFGNITVGMRAAVVPEFPSDTVHVAPVTIVDRVIDAASGTFGVRLELPNPEHNIPVGLHCQVRFLTE
ncbi:MAG: efflux RND transporter periplasmic adaptor subunit [Myxococcales bacterium]|nr:efflux RND transporter periplasmic adaptor subunit [Myxococcales bacterium]